MNLTIDKDKNWYILYSFKTSRQKSLLYDYLMEEKPICSDLSIKTHPDDNAQVLLFSWIKITESDCKEMLRRTSEITHTEVNGKWFIVETLSSTYTFLKVSPDEALKLLKERMELNE